MKVSELNTVTFSEFGKILTMDTIGAVDKKNEFDWYTTAGQIEMAPLCCSGLLSCRYRDRKVVKMECHHGSSEVIVALDGDMIMVAAPNDDDLKDNSRVRAFLIRKGQAIAMKPSTWHWIPFPVEKNDCHALVIFRDGTGDDDLNFKTLVEPVVVE